MIVIPRYITPIYLPASIHPCISYFCVFAPARPAWGEAGFAKIERGVGDCGFGCVAYQPVVAYKATEDSTGLGMQTLAVKDSNSQGGAGISTPDTPGASDQFKKFLKKDENVRIFAAVITVGAFIVAVAALVAVRGYFSPPPRPPPESPTAPLEQAANIEEQEPPSPEPPKSTKNRHISLLDKYEMDDSS